MPEEKDKASSGETTYYKEQESDLELLTPQRHESGTVKKFRAPRRSPVAKDNKT
jgi:hypothetical protein